jgi:signal transduction histidine kinase
MLRRRIEEAEMGNVLYALIVEDSEDDAILIARHLRGDYELTFERVDTPGAMQAALQRQEWDVVIADYSMPRFSGLDALKVLQESGLDLPFIIVSGAIGEDVAVQAMLAGAHDYLMKDNLARLVPAVQRELAEAQERRARRQAEADLRRRADELAAITRLSSEISSAHLDLHEVLASIARHAALLSQSDASGVFIPRPDGSLYVAAGYGVGEEFLQALETQGITPGQGLVGQAVAERRAIQVSDAPAGPGDALAQLAALQDLRATLVVPMLRDERVSGGIVLWRRQAGSFAPQEVVFIQALAQQCINAVENARLLQAESRRRRDAEAFFAAHAALAIETAQQFALEEQRVNALSHSLAKQQELDQLKDEFIQNVSHELRAPLGLIRGYAELLEDGYLGELQTGQQGPIAVIVRRARLLNDMVDALTILLESETGQTRRDPVDLAALTRDTLADFQSTLDQAGLTLSSYIAPALPSVCGDVNHLRRVLDNLLGNACKFTLPGGRISVRLEQKGDRLALEVSDTGIGIASDQLERIFERFYQMDGTMSRRYGGAGLGLALVKEIVERHGGQVSVQSAPGQGSAFLVLLPCE